MDIVEFTRRFDLKELKTKEYLVNHFGENNYMYNICKGYSLSNVAIDEMLDNVVRYNIPYKSNKSTLDMLYSTKQECQNVTIFKEEFNINMNIDKDNFIIELRKI